MEKVFETLNNLEAVGVVARYAIGGAMGAFFYAEAVVTEDLDAFVITSQPAGGIITLSPIYEFLKARGAMERREHLVVGGSLLQIIPAYDALTEEAVREAVEQRVGQTAARVMRSEHLIAIALKTGRAKDHARVALLLEEADVDSALLTGILERHQLLDQWNQFKATQS